MSADDLHSVLNSILSFSFRLNALNKPSHQGHIVDDDDVHDSAPAPLKFLPSGDLILGPLNVSEHIDKFSLSLIARRFTVMDQNRDRLDFIYAGHSGRRDIALGAWTKCWLVFDCGCASCFGHDKLQLDMAFFCYPKERDYVVRLSTLVVLQNGIGVLSDQVSVDNVSDWPFDVLPLLKKHGRWRRN